VRARRGILGVLWPPRLSSPSPPSQ
jgi:hypothetical protein